MLVKPHWSVRYGFDGIGQRRWKRKNPGRPWFTRQAVEIVVDWIKPTDAVLKLAPGVQPHG